MVCEDSFSLPSGTGLWVTAEGAQGDWHSWGAFRGLSLGKFSLGHLKDWMKQPPCSLSGVCGGWQSREVSEDWKKDSLPSIQDCDSAEEISQPK